MAKGSVFMAMCAVFLSNGEARATDYPTECSEGVYATYYDIGLATGRSLVSQAWDGIGQSCWRVDQLDQAVSDSIDAYLPILEGVSDTFARRLMCRFGGHVDGMTQRAAELMGGCGVYCCNQGTSMGAHYAHAYCLIAVAANGVYDSGAYFRPDVPYCGGLYESCCDDAAYEYAWDWYDCRPYLAWPYSVAFGHYVDFTCAF